MIRARRLLRVTVVVVLMLIIAVVTRHHEIVSIDQVSLYALTFALVLTQPSVDEVARFLDHEYPLVHASRPELAQLVFLGVYRDHDALLKGLLGPMDARCKAYFASVDLNGDDPLVDPFYPEWFDQGALHGLAVFADRFTKKRIAELKKEATKKKKAELKQQKIADGTWQEGMKLKVDVDENLLFDAEDMARQAEQKFHDTVAYLGRDHDRLREFLAHTKAFNQCYLRRSVDHQAQDNAFVVAQRQAVQKHWGNRDWTSIGSSLIKARPGVFGGRQFKGETVENAPSCRELERQVYAWLTGTPPKMTQLATGAVKKLDVSDSDCFLNQWKHQLKGRGIVMTVADGHVDDTVRLFQVLAVLKNKLPIQVIFQGAQLLEENRQVLTQAAKRTGQDVWTVDILEALSPIYAPAFSGFGNKILAVLFNTFAEIMLVDADTVLLKNPSHFFGMARYRRSGTLFFKDRALAQFRAHEDEAWFSHLFPSQLETAVFGTSQVTNHTMHLMFFTDRFYHLMELGVVLVNRLRHFEQPLVMAVLLWFYLIKFRVYGDKELFWLLLAILGDELYQFNDNYAAAVGEETPRLELGTYKIAREICLNHPGHISDEDNHTLLWVNLGFRHCGQDKVNYQKEFDRKTRYSAVASVDAFRSLFEGPLKITLAVIPPHRQLIANNDIGEPRKAWIHMKDYCAEYTWCGYDRIGGSTNPDHIGQFIQFSKDEQKHFAKIGTAWMANYS